MVEPVRVFSFLKEIGLYDEKNLVELTRCIFYEIRFYICLLNYLTFIILIAVHPFMMLCILDVFFYSIFDAI